MCEFLSLKVKAGLSYPDEHYGYFRGGTEPTIPLRDKNHESERESFVYGGNYALSAVEEVINKYEALESKGLIDELKDIIKRLRR